MAHNNVMCAGGCENVARPGSRFCAKCDKPRASRDAGASEPDLFSQPPIAEKRTRAALPDRVALNHPPHQQQSPTSTAAADAIAPQFPTQLQRVLAAVLHAKRQGLTRAELADVLKMRLSSVCSAVRTLYRQGLIGSNPDETRVDPDTHMHVEVLVGEQYVERWLDASRALIPRRTRSMLDGAPCDLVDPSTDKPITEGQLGKTRQRDTDVRTRRDWL